MAVASVMTAGRLLVRCLNRPGIIAAVSRFILERDGDIGECSQYASGATFFQRTVFASPALDERFVHDFEREVAERFEMEWRLLERRGADVERTVLARALAWHCEDRVLRNGRTTVVL